MLEMLAVRHLKSVSVNFINHLQNSASCLLPVSVSRALIRYATGASRAFDRRRDPGDGGELPGPLSQFDRNSCQWRTVARMLHIMRESNFLSVSHRGAERLTNVFTVPTRIMNIKKDQDEILAAAKRGVVTAKLHASVLFPGIFGRLTDEDRKTYFSSKHFKNWTRCRSVIRPAQSIANSNGMSFPGEESSSFIKNASIVDGTKSFSRRKVDKENHTRILNDLRKGLSKIKYSFAIEQRKAVAGGNIEYLEGAMKRWDEAHHKRHVTSAFADCFYDMDGNINHGSKSRFMKHSTRDNRDVCYPFNAFAVGYRVSQNIYSAAIAPFFSVQIDIMNSLHYRGDTGERGTSVMEVVTGKMKSVLKPWLTGTRAARLHQIHLHIDDPFLLINQKGSEQRRRDERGAAATNNLQDAEEVSEGHVLHFDEELSLPCSSLLNNRKYKDEPASLHLFCSALAAFELLHERSPDCSVFLHGGKFAIDSSFTQSRPHDFYPSRFDERIYVDDALRGSVILIRKDEQSATRGTLFCIPRNRFLVFETEVKAFLGMHASQHGESETRFVASFKAYIERPFNDTLQAVDLARQISTSPRGTVTYSASVIVSDDTDVFIILLCNNYMHNYGVKHVLNDTVHGIDSAVFALCNGDMTCLDMGAAYCIAGYDLAPSHYGIRHDYFIEVLSTFRTTLRTMNAPLLEDETKWNTFICMVYLQKYGKRQLLTTSQRRERCKAAILQVTQGVLRHKEFTEVQNCIFQSENSVRSSFWTSDKLTL